MALNKNDIQNVAYLARIEIDDQEAEQTLNKLTGILDLIAQMQTVDTTNITPMSHAQDLNQRLREDTVTQQNQREAFQQNAPAIAHDELTQAVKDGLYLVPKVIDS